MSKKKTRKQRQSGVRGPTKISASISAPVPVSAPIPARGPMGIYSEYLDRKFDMESLIAERKKQLLRIQAVRQRDILVYAADLKKNGSPIAISYPDLLPITDQLSNLSGKEIDLIVETPGGSAEVAEHIVRILRGRYENVAVIVPGVAFSAGTILAMSADDILMDQTSALGPIDAQMQWQGKVFSADALLKGFQRIKDEVSTTQQLNRAYLPILQGISPGELESAENALDLARVLVTDWLARYKLKTWTKRTTSGADVSDEDRKKRAQEIANAMCDHSRWKSHGRFFRLDVLTSMGLKITDYSDQGELADAIRRYFTLLQMTFDGPVYKLFETPASQIYRSAAPNVGVEIPVIELRCQKCRTMHKIQANVENGIALRPGHVPFPADNRFQCSNCGHVHDLLGARRQIEQQTGKKIVS